MSRLVRDDVSWRDWLAVRQRAYRRPPDAIAAVAGQLHDWPDAVRLVASDPEQRIDPWWVEGWEASPQPWLSLVRALWVPAEEIVDLAPDSAWVREGLSEVTTWVVDRALPSDMVATCRALLSSLTTVDLTYFAGPGLDAWIRDLAPVAQLLFGGAAAKSRLLDVVIERHGATLTGLELNGMGVGLSGLRRLSEWPSSGRLRHLAIRDDAINLNLFARVPLPWLDDLVSLDLARVGRPGHRHEWLNAPNLEMLSLTGIPLAGTARALFAQVHLPRLQRLRLASTQLDVQGLAAAITAAWSAALTCLDLRNNALPDAALDVLDLERAAGWDHLLLSGNRFSQPALERFAQKHGLTAERPDVLSRPIQ